jgi:phage shock protein A
LEQRIREANAAFEAGKRDLAMVLAAEIGTRIAEEEAAAVRALDAGNEAEAERLAERLAGLSDDLKAHQLAASDCADAARRIRKSLESNARLLGELRRGLATAKGGRRSTAPISVR